MNKKGNLFLGFALCIFLWAMGILFLPFITEGITDARVLIECSNSSGITDGTKLMCLNLDIIVPYFIWFVASVALGYIAGGNN